MSRFYSSKFGSFLSLVATLLTVAQPTITLADAPATTRDSRGASLTRQTFADVELRPGGVLVGQVVSESGIGIAGAKVTLTDGQRPRQAKTDPMGWFQISSLRGGAYQFQADGQTQLLRLWSPGTAPPVASQGVLVTPPSDVFRGQRVLSPNTNQFFRVAKQRLADPLVVTGVALTAVAIPVAIHNSDDDPPASP